tara:strand:- start:468 stop:1487 length:1020 start_codon:yes stop_codon:yes gene_type:complete
MEDYESNILNDSKNEWSIRLMNILSGHIIDGFRSIFNESMEVCEKNDEPEKYLMTFQNFLSMIPKWNQNIVDTEVTRIKLVSQCNYLEDLITCVHILQLKILSCVRTSNKNQKIDIDIPCFKSFLHLVYINIARKLYSNIYLFQIDITPLEQQKNNREFELIVQTCIMNTIRDNIPIEILLKQYIDETQEIDVETTEKIIHDPKPKISPSTNSDNKLNETNILSNNSISKEVETLDNQDIGLKSDNVEPLESVTFQDLPEPQTDSFEDLKEENLNVVDLDIVDDTSEKDNNILNIGEDVPLNYDTDFDDNSDAINKELEEANLMIEETPIDLDVEELTI